MGLGLIQRSGLSLSFLISAIVAGVVSAASAVPAFPGAVGEGMNASGGRGGDVYHVTNLNSSGVGSFAYGVTGTGPRTIVFDVSGTITNTSNLQITRDNLTIAGQTAPGMGIVIRNWGTAIRADNVIMQHMRLRPGDAAMGTDAQGKFNEYSLAVDGVGIMVDHCSVSWSVSQLVTVDGSGFNDVTIQNCLLGEALAQTGLYHGALDPTYNPGATRYHGNGLFVKPLEGVGGTSSCTAYQNLLADNTSRNPCPGAYNLTQSTLFEFTNNVIYNCRNSGYSSGTAAWVKMNYVGNYLIAGPSTTSGSKAFDANAQCNVSIYQAGNKVDTDLDTVRDGTDMDWTSFIGTYAKLTSPVSMDPVPVLDADTAYNNVLAQSGAFWWNRDVVDDRIINDVLTQTGTYINSPKDRKDPNGILTDANGYPIIPVVSPRAADWDTDTDGMPNFWEQIYGTNPSLADNNGDLDADGYTNLEEYIQYAAIPEPATLSLIFLGGLALLRKSRQCRAPF